MRARCRRLAVLLSVLPLAFTLPAAGRCQTAAPPFDAAWLGMGDPGGAGPGRWAGGWTLALGQGRLHGLAELPLQRLGVARRTGSTSFAAGWQRCGPGDTWHEDALDLCAARGGTVRWGLRAGVVHDSAVGTGRLLRLLAIRERERWSWELTLPLLSEGPPRATTLLRLRHRGGAATLALQLDRGDDGTLLPAIAWWPLVRDGVGWGLRCETATGQLGLLLVLGGGRPVVRLAALTHPVLGTTTLWDLQWHWGERG